MKHLKVGYSPLAEQYFDLAIGREKVCLDNTDFTDVAVAVITDQEMDYLDNVKATGFNIPVIAVLTEGKALDLKYMGQIDMSSTRRTRTPNAVTTAARLNRLQRRTKKTYYRRSSVRWLTMWQPANRSLTARAIRVVCSTVKCPQAVLSLISLAKTYSAPTFATPTLSWATS